MILISHRGNLNGPLLYRENTESYITEALNKGFQVEIDVWAINNVLFLGHDHPNRQVEHDFVRQRGLWVHAKNIRVLELLLPTSTIVFFHDNDRCALTSNNFIWNHVDERAATNRTIVVLPEKKRIDFIDKKCAGICSDYISRYIGL